MLSQTAIVDRVTRATVQAVNYHIFPASLDANDYTLVKLDGTREYTVDLDKQTCTCPDHQRRGVACKHFHMARRFAFQHPETLVDTEETTTTAGEDDPGFPDVETVELLEELRMERIAQARRERALWD